MIPRTDAESVVEVVTDYLSGSGTAPSGGSWCGMDGAVWLLSLSENVDIVYSIERDSHMMEVDVGDFCYGSIAGARIADVDGVSSLIVDVDDGTSISCPIEGAVE